MMFKQNSHYINYFLNGIMTILVRLGLYVVMNQLSKEILLEMVVLV